MILPLQITFRNLPHSDAVEAAIRERAAKLDRFHPHIISCRVAVEAQTRSHVKGNVFHVRIDVTVPGAELVVGRDPGEPAAHQDVYVAIRDAFDGIRRKLQDHARKMRGDTKQLVGPPHGRVTKFFPQQGYGFLETPDEREVYFHEHAVLNGGFNRLQVGTEVRFTEELGNEGPQASTVAIVGHA
jgi:ribosomal subunit interface protein